MIEQLRPIARRLVGQAFAPAAARRNRLILVSSAGADESRSFTAVNLALALSQDQGRAVLLVDADPRTAGSARALGQAPEPGLTDALGEGAAVTDLVRPACLHGLGFVAPGRPSAALAGLLASRRAARLVRGLLVRDPGGLVVIDGPPLLEGTAGATLAMFAGQVVVVVAAGRTSERALDDALRRLGERPNVGLVLTQAARPPAVMAAHPTGSAGQGTMVG